MANQFGYNQTFTDKPEMWNVDGYAVCTDGYGTLVVQIRVVSTKGTLDLVNQLPPSAVIQSITQTGNSTGIYDVFLKETWNQCTFASFQTVIPAGQSPAVLLCQDQGDTVGQTGFGPGQTALQSIRFKTIVPSTGAAGSLAQGCGLYFKLTLKNSSA